MSIIRGIAERLRSDHENERQSAVNLIERKTGLMIVDIIRKGAIRHLTGTPQQWVLEHLQTKTGDRMIVAVSREIAALKTSWGDIVEAGSLQSASTPGRSRDPWEQQGGTSRPYEPQPDFSAAWNDAFASFMETAGESMWQHARAEPPLTEKDINDLYNSVKSARSDMEQGFTRVSREDLPVGATGKPRITRRGVAKTGKGYAIVSFRRMTSYGGKNIAPMCEFIAFGDEWIDEIEQAEKDDLTVSVTFGADRQPNKHVVIHNAL